MEKPDDIEYGFGMNGGCIFVATITLIWKTKYGNIKFIVESVTSNLDDVIDPTIYVCCTEYLSEIYYKFKNVSEMAKVFKANHR